jgi:hypothetical protein
LRANQSVNLKTTLKENAEFDNIYSMFSIECKSSKKATKGDILIATTITSHDTSCLIVSDITPITSRRNKIRWRYEPQQCSRKKNSTGKGPVKTHFTRSRRPGYILAETMYWCH